MNGNTKYIYTPWNITSLCIYTPWNIISLYTHTHTHTHTHSGISVRHEKERNSFLKRKESLTQATIWMKLEDMLSEKNQTQKDKYYMILLI